MDKVGSIQLELFPGTDYYFSDSVMVCTLHKLRLSSLHNLQHVHTRMRMNAQSLTARLTRQRPLEKVSAAFVGGRDP